MIRREEFLEYLKNLLTEEDKKEVKSATRAYKIMGIIFMIIGAAVAIYGIATFSDGVSIAPIFGGLIFALVGIGIFAARKSRGYMIVQSKYKSIVVHKIMDGHLYGFHAHSCISKQIYFDSRLPRGYDEYEGEDLLSISIPNDDGKFTDVRLNISDVKTVSISRDDEGRESRTTLYNGVLGYISFPFNFQCILTINRNDYAVGMGLEKVDLEGIEFNKKFAIKSNDQIESRYILTTDFMQKLDLLAKNLKRLGLVFHNNRMYITMPGKRLFNVRVKGKDICGSVFESFYDDIELLMNLIKEIQQNDKVFKLD